MYLETLKDKIPEAIKGAVEDMMILHLATSKADGIKLLKLGMIIEPKNKMTTIRMEVTDLEGYFYSYNNIIDVRKL